MRRFLKTVFQKPYTSQELAATIEAHLIRPPFPKEWYEVAQSVRDKNGRGLADAWREKLIIDELNDVASRPTWKTQKQKLLEYVLDHVQIVKFQKHMNKIKTEEAKEILFRGCYEDDFEVWQKTSLLCQQFMTSVVSEVVLLEIGHRLYGFDDFLKLQLEYWDGLTNRFQELKCNLWDSVFLAEEPELVQEFAIEVMHPILQEYSALVKLTSREIAAGDFDIKEIQERNLQVEYKLMEVGDHLLKTSGVPEEELDRPPSVSE
jgi:hypothetical protein